MFKKVILFMCAILSLLGFLFGMMLASGGYGGWEWNSFFGVWITFSIPLIIILIFKKVFNKNKKEE